MEWWGGWNGEKGWGVLDICNRNSKSHRGEQYAAESGELGDHGDHGGNDGTVNNGYNESLRYRELGTFICPDVLMKIN